jgi:hypothetical protein
VPTLARPARLVTVLVAVTIVALTLAAQSSAARLVDRGIVQRVSAGRVVLRALDGSVVVARVTPRTRVLVDDRPAQVQRIEPGFVAEVTSTRTGRALVVRAFGRSRRVLEGLIVSASRSAFILRLAGGGLDRIPITSRTRVRLGTSPAGSDVLRAGRRARVLRAADGTALLITVGRRTQGGGG